MTQCLSQEALATLLLMISDNGLPGLLATIAADGVAQIEHRNDLEWSPMHPGAFQSRLDHHFVTTPHTATPDWPALAQILRIIHLSVTGIKVPKMPD
ncbi:MAG: hypothetical protein E4H27_06830 [Anaerolineales bacterium]|nr:MAG: hypothetical protein E4H27_06830 [Anaerolineales bacterium]